MNFVQISDLHIGLPGQRLQGVVDTAAHLVRTLEAIARLDPAPEFMVITGDLVEGGQAEEYAHLRRLLAPFERPIYLIAGNHDEREALRAAFSDQSWLPRQGPLQFVIESHPLRLIALDTVVSGAPHGELDAQRLAWLEDRLDEGDKRACAILMHHPPFDTGIAHMDAMALNSGRAELAAIVARHGEVQAILCGHVHRAIETRFGGTLAAICPSPAHQIALDLSVRGPAAFIMEPGGYRTWRWDGRSLVAHLGVVGDFAGPYAYD